MVEVVADEIGPSLRWATAEVERNERRGGDGAVAAAARRAVGGPAPPTELPAATRSRSRWTQGKVRERTPKGKDAARSKKKTSILVQERIEYVDYKDVNLLRRFMSDRAKIRARRVSGNGAQQQRDVALAIKNAREMALLPYTMRVTYAARRRPRWPWRPRRPRRPRRSGDRGDRGDVAAPTPSRRACRGRRDVDGADDGRRAPSTVAADGGDER